ncbi:HAD family hydrolase [Streptomyces albofaciens]|uniref:HAD family hydrolase n=1 Tax=Streptomyces albofaciens TaxID=66866 RepID=UPI001AD7477B|nr:HAD family hydrolase [Streptomyces albofaciens]
MKTHHTTNRRHSSGPPLRPFSAVLIDVDLVLTDFATVRAAAWKRTFDTFLKEIVPPAPARIRPFDAAEDFRLHVDGRTSLDGALAFLDARGIDVPVGAPAAPAGWSSVHALVARADQVLEGYVRRYGVTARPGTVRLVRALRTRGIPVAAVSAVRHAGDLLDRAEAGDVFSAVLDPGKHTAPGLPGPPSPDLLVEWAHRLSVAPTRTAVLERSLPGVRAARRGRFGITVAVDESRAMRHAAELRQAGAELVARSPDELSGTLTALAEGRYAA